jgi:hypothetical protein
LKSVERWRVTRSKENELKNFTKILVALMLVMGLVLAGPGPNGMPGGVPAGATGNVVDTTSGTTTATITAVDDDGADANDPNANWADYLIIEFINPPMSILLEWDPNSNMWTDGMGGMWSLQGGAWSVAPSANDTQAGATNDTRTDADGSSNGSGVNTIDIVRTS